MRQTRSMHRSGRTVAFALLTLGALAACRAASGADASSARTDYGDPVKIGNGTARACIVTPPPAEYPKSVLR